MWWICVQCRSLHCKGSLKPSLALGVPVSAASHSHGPNLASDCVTKPKASIKYLGAQTREKPGHLSVQTANDLPDDAK